jgi:ketosteroid isomerase-like protein
MSQENVNVVRSIHADWKRGDYSSAEWADPEIEYVHADGPEIGSWKGLPGMSEGFRQFLRAWEEFRVEAEEFRALDADRVLVLFNFTGRGKRSGLEAQEIRTKGAQLFQIRGGKVTRLVQYLNRDNAFADLGIETESLRP